MSKGRMRALAGNSLLKAAFRAARREGWAVTRTGHGLCWQSPYGRTVFTSSTPRYRGAENDKQKLRAAGLQFKG